MLAKRGALLFSTISSHSLCKGEAESQHHEVDDKWQYHCIASSLVSNKNMSREQWYEYMWSVGGRRSAEGARAANGLAEVGAVVLRL